MTAPAAQRPSDARLVWRQLGYEQLSFWRNPFAAMFTVGFSVVFLVLLGLSGSSQRISELGNIRTVEYYVPGFVAYGVMAASFNSLAIGLVIRRETGLLKRLRLSPLPTWIALAGVLANAMVVALIQVVLLVGIGRVAYDVALPNMAALVLAVVVGVVCFAALAAAAASVIPNQDAAGPAISIVFFVLLYLSGLWFPLDSGSTLARISSWFPVRHFMLATFAPFDPRQGHGVVAWRDLGLLALWGVVGVAVAIRNFRWEPRRS